LLRLVRHLETVQRQHQSALLQLTEGLKPGGLARADRA